MCCQKIVLSRINIKHKSSVDIVGLFTKYIYLNFYLQQVLNLQPYHIDSLLQLSDVCRMSEDTAMATDLLGKSVYCCRTPFMFLFMSIHGFGHRKLISETV